MQPLFKPRHFDSREFPFEFSFMRRIVYVAAVALLAASCNKQINSIVTAEATDVTMTSAVLYGYINPEYLLAGGESGFIVSTSSTPSLDNGQKVISSEVDKNGRYFVKMSGLMYSTTYYYKAFLNTGTTNLVGDVKSFRTKDFEFSAIDMGLSVKWANANLGATAPEESGDYYAWGETETKESYSLAAYKWYDVKTNTLTKYITSASYGTVDSRTTLSAADEVARVKLGGKWRMPTIGDVQELVSTRNNSNYQWEWKCVNGHNGWLVTYLVNNNSIFLPAAGYWSANNFSFNVGILGYYWSSSLYADLPKEAIFLYFSSTEVYTGRFDRSKGFPVRPVTE